MNNEEQSYHWQSHLVETGQASFIEKFLILRSFRIRKDVEDQQNAEWLES